MDLVSAIEKRRSVRRYAKQPVPKHVVEQVIAAAKDAAPLNPEVGVRWYTVWDGSVLYRCLERQSVVRGVFTPPPHYILAVSEERPGYMENLGFCMEQMILAATDLGLGTCWIGGMFRETSLYEFAPDLAADERIVALTPLGYADTSQKADIARRLLRWQTNDLGRRKPLSDMVSQDIWAVPWISHDETLNEILECTRLAPSWVNTQPWHFVVDERQVIATVDHTPQAGNVREGKPYYRLDGGIAMCHFFLAARAAGWTGRWRVPEAAEAKMLRDRYAIPKEYDVLGVYRLTRPQ
jgi:nitroreductase